VQAEASDDPCLFTDVLLVEALAPQMDAIFDRARDLHKKRLAIANGSNAKQDGMNCQNGVTNKRLPQETWDNSFPHLSMIWKIAVVSVVKFGSEQQTRGICFVTARSQDEKKIGWRRNETCLSRCCFKRRKPTRCRTLFRFHPQSAAVDVACNPGCRRALFHPSTPQCTLRSHRAEVHEFGSR
jgi:hypothetical protein